MSLWKITWRGNIRERIVTCDACSFFLVSDRADLFSKRVKLDLSNVDDQSFILDMMPVHCRHCEEVLINNGRAVKLGMRPSIVQMDPIRLTARAASIRIRNAINNDIGSVHG